MLALPVVAKLLEAPQHRKQTEVHRAHVQRGELRLELDGGLEALVDRHVRAAARRHVDHGVRCSGNLR